MYYCPTVGKVKYQHLPMGLSNSPDIFQEKMSELFASIEYVQAYIDDILCLTTSSFDDHLNKPENIFTILQSARLKVNANKSFFAQAKLEYLGCQITREGIKPTLSKVQAIQAIAPPKNCQQLQRFIRIVNYYCHMWI